MIEPFDHSVWSKMKVISLVRHKQHSCEIRQDQDGFTHITCGCETFARKSWCPHVELIYTDETITMKVIPEWAPMIVIFKSPVWLIIPTIVVPSAGGQQSDFFRVDVLWGNPHRVVGEYEAEGGETIGFISRYNRRKSIRNLVLEWLPSLLYKEGHLSCLSKLHTPGDSLLDEYTDQYNSLSDNDRRRILADAYNIYDQGKCIACYTSSSVPF